MDIIIYLIPIALLLGLIGLGAFLWSLRSGQFDDLDGAAHRILFDDADDPHAEATRRERQRPERQPAGAVDSNTPSPRR
ncbi:MAG: cbb3-type cytochrome oxidase assembly protein CcoS [Azospirillaceae bacterium]